MNRAGSIEFLHCGPADINFEKRNRSSRGWQGWRMRIESQNDVVYLPCDLPNSLQERNVLFRDTYSAQGLLVVVLRVV